jgi:hypothetical protein
VIGLSHLCRPRPTAEEQQRREIARLTREVASLEEVLAAYRNALGAATPLDAIGRVADLHSRANRAENLARELEEARERERTLRQAMREVGAFAACHHGDQEDHYWLHALVVDIPHMVECALATPQEASEPASNPVEK